MYFPYGNNLKIYIEGGSHDEQMELFIDNFPANVAIDAAALASFLHRRAPGNNGCSTRRKECDVPVFVSGVDNAVTTGGRIHAYIKNTDAHSADYADVNDIPRPSHADYAAVMKYGAGVDLRGAGHFSGRLTAMLCVAGYLCKQYLLDRGIEVFAHAYCIADVCDTPFDLADVGVGQARQLEGSDFPVLDANAGERMKAAIIVAGNAGDSVGGVAECAAVGLPAGLGEHMFAGVEGRVSAAVFSIPAVKGIEFGAGFASAAMTGSQNNDAFITDGKTVRTVTNNCGGILGSMTDGMPLVFRAAIKPTPSISAKQRSVSLSRMENVDLEIKGRHDPCIVPRAVPAVEAAAAIALCDIMLDGVKGE